MPRKISCILYRYPISVFGGFVKFEVKYVMDEASLQEMFSMYIESRAQVSFIELYVEFEQFEADRNIVREDYNSDSEEEFESNYEVVGPDGDEDQGDGTMAPNVTDVANALANEVPFEEPSFMRVLDLDAMHVPEFPEYMSVVFSARLPSSQKFLLSQTVNLPLGWNSVPEKLVDYRVYESELLTFYAKCTQYGSGCDWLVKVSMISRKHCWIRRRYNSSHTCTRATISQEVGFDHNCRSHQAVGGGLPLVKEVQSKFNYTVSYRKAWLVKQKAVEKIYGGWKASYETLPI
ncbi:hypothetical protein Ahy_B04g069799 isoform A [Arachis hypogaea]|uniref:Transposase MuDR plant domain-containing protein n=1 Tax=Arachis hypogaea TaxID=3818 RepID=A0A444ZDM6_ARAHY|nr:hypothetical protein Ahy_B04g069799 isoform A [Arachis hypogaea]